MMITTTTLPAITRAFLLPALMAFTPRQASSVFYYSGNQTVCHAGLDPASRNALDSGLRRNDRYKEPWGIQLPP
jgi:hypothetical protein